MGLAAIGNYKVAGPLTAGHLFWASASLGDALQRVKKITTGPSQSISAPHDKLKIIS
jgi:hypothetical protein